MRKIVSFVRRQGRMNNAQKIAIETLWSKHVLEPDQTPKFKNTNKIVFEIGFGMGKNLIHLAKENPNKNYIGVDVHKPGIGSVLIKIEEIKLTNIKLYCCDAVELLKKSIPDRYIDELLLFFPDPWKKTKHKKRRLINSSFVSLIETKLKKEGVLYLATDWEDYANKMISVIDSSCLFVNMSKSGRFADSIDFRPLTKFEARGKRLGHTIFNMIYIVNHIKIMR